MTVLFTVTFVVELLFALGFIAAPGFLLGNFGVVSTPELVFLGRTFGSALLAFCTFLWYARTTESAELQKTVIRGMFVYWLLSTIFALMGQLAGLFNAMGWSTVVLHAGFLIWYGTFAFKK